MWEAQHPALDSIFGESPGCHERHQWHLWTCLRKERYGTMEQQDRIMDGDLQTLGLQSILKMLALSGKTGTLFVYSGPETLTISLRRGQIVALREEGVPQPDLLMMLCLVNKLDAARVQLVREYA